MPTTYLDQFFEIDPYSPPAAGTPMTVDKLNLVDQDDDDDIEAAGGDTVGGWDVTASWPGDTVTIELPDGTQITYTGITFYVDDGGTQREFFTPTDGQVLQAGTLVSATGVTSQGPLDVGDLGPPCFTAGTRIETERGQVPVEELVDGMMVRTLDNGLQPLRAVVRRTFPAMDEHAPIRIEAGALGNFRLMVVSPQHRFMLTGWRAELYFGQPEVLVSAKGLLGQDGVSVNRRDDVEYIHLVFDDHQIVFSEGIPTESLDPDGAFAQTDRLLKTAIGARAAANDTVRPVVRTREASLLIAG